jgi:RNA polymerase sigma-70 factor (ECF subfamily)
MPEDASFADLLARLRAGDDSAAALVVGQFTYRLVALARNHLSRDILRKEDPEDVLQSVFKSFFLRYAEGQFRLEDRDSLWALLVSLTLHKCGHRAEYFRAARRDVRREARLSPLRDTSDPDWGALAREPTPVEAARLGETVERLLGGLEPHQRQIVQRSLEGETVAQISIQLDVTERTVQRVLKGVRERLERWRAEDQDGP